MRILLLGFVLCFSWQLIFSQDALQEQESSNWSQRQSLSLNLSPLFNLVNGGIGLSYEIPLGKGWAIQGEAGPIFYHLGNNFENESHKGYRLRGSMKYYFTVDNSTTGYVKGVLKFNRVVNKSYETVLSLGSNWQEEFLLKGTLQSYGPSLQIGSSGLLGYSDRLFYDFSFGMGLLFWDYPIDNFPEGFQREDRSVLLQKGSSGSILDVVLQFQVGWLFGGG